MTHRRAFVLTELVAVVVVFALVACMLFVINARRTAAGRAMACSQNLQAQIAGLNMFTDANGYFPPSYAYGQDLTSADWRMEDQQSNNPNPANGYVHWSGMLLAAGMVANEDAFACPEFTRGGAPAANPGPDAADWESGQVNDLGSGAPAAIPNDRQARRMAYTANAAIMPRNKFAQGGSVRRAQLVSSGWQVLPPGFSFTRTSDIRLPENVRTPHNTIVLTEFATLPNGRWETVAMNGGSGNVFKSHRPVTPFVGLAAGTDVFNEPDSGTAARFAYPNAGAILPAGSLYAGVIADQQTELNAVGRQHEGGTAEFAFLDGHVERQTVQQTIQQRRWGDRFWSMTGNNAVRP